MFTIVVSLVLVFLNSSPTYATHQSENLIWQVVMISSTPACSNYHHQMVGKYTDLTEEYFELYELEDENYQGECLTESTFSWKYQKPYDLDLLIIVYDKNKGEEDLHSLEIGGLYSHTGDPLTHNHTIVFCDCSDFNFSNPAWILSHELSHFVLNYLGYDLSVVEDEIHEMDDKYDYCIENHNDVSCEGIIAKIKSSQYSNTFTVMAPYEQAIGEGFANESDEVFLYDTESNMLNEITKWWIEGRISDYYFAKSIEILTGVSSKRTVESNDSLIKESNWLLIAESPKNKKESEKQNLAQRTDEIIEKLSFIDLHAPNTEDMEIPNWFKEKSQAWINDKIDDDEFYGGLEAFLYSEDPSNYLENNDVRVEDIVKEGMIFLDDEEYLQAITLFDKALWESLDDDTPSIDAIIGKGVSLFLLGNYSESLIYFDLVLDFDSNNYDATKRKAQTLAQLGQFDEAKEYFEKSITIKNLAKL